MFASVDLFSFSLFTLFSVMGLLLVGLLVIYCCGGCCCYEFVLGFI